jgi:hypothetical protein
MRGFASVRNLQLHVHVVEAADIPRTDFLGQPDVYMTLQLSNAAAQQSTDVIPDTQNPIWNQMFHFALPDPSCTVLFAVIKSRSVFGADTPLAQLGIPLAQFAPYHVADRWWHMQPLARQGTSPTVRIVLQIAPGTHPAFEPAPPPAQPQAPMWHS